MIEIKNISKTFDTANGDLHALKNVSLTVNDGEIYGIIGMSGAGKSTLVRCINMLEKPTDGEIFIDGVTNEADIVYPMELFLGAAFVMLFCFIPAKIVRNNQPKHHEELLKQMEKAE